MNARFFMQHRQFIFAIWVVYPILTITPLTMAQATDERITDPVITVTCTEPRPQNCIQIYQPVCVTRDTGIRCVLLHPAHLLN